MCVHCTCGGQPCKGCHAGLMSRIAELEADCAALALGYLGISPDRNTQLSSVADAEDMRLLEIARKHNPYAVKG